MSAGLFRKAGRKIRAVGSTGVEPSHPNGHFYSPVTDPADLFARQGEIWPESPGPCLGVDFNDASHREILEEWFPRHIGSYDYPEQEREKGRFYTRNPAFSWLDSRTLFVILNEVRPARVIEIGSGYSSLLTADVNHRFLGGSVDFSCIEPYPKRFLKKDIPGLGRLLVSRVEAIEYGFFERLEPGDLLFVDSSHVSKTGSDVNYIFFEILPRLPSGVLIHFHDIFLPFEYPKAWAIEKNRSWNEQYLLRALLMGGDDYRVMFGCNYAVNAHNARVARALNLPGGRALGGGSFWLKKA